MALGLLEPETLVRDTERKFLFAGKKTNENKETKWEFMQAKVMF